MRTYLTILFIFVFLFVLVLSLFLQLYLYPEFFSNYYFRDGMLKNGDWIRYNELALLQLSEMLEGGLSKWSLYPLANDKISTHSISGITSLYYYLTNSDKPYFVAPFHAFIHATTCLYLLLTITYITKIKRLPIIAILIFLSLPSASIYFTHINKEIYFWFSISIIFYNSTLFLNINSKDIKYTKYTFINLLLLFIAVFLIFVLRPQFAQVFALFYILILLIKITYNLIFNRLFLYSYLILLSFLTLFISIYVSPVQKSLIASISDNYQVVGSELTFNNSLTDNEKVEIIKKKFNFFINDTKSLHGTISWKKNKLIPDEIDRVFFTIYKVRENFKLREKISIDSNRSLNSVTSIILYFPESIIKGYFLPFYKDWFKNNEIVGSKAKFLFIYEMLVTYIGLIFFITFFFNKFNYNLLYLFLFSSLFISIIIYLYPNIGTLFRYRFYFINIISITGWTFLLSYLIEFYKIKKI